MTSSEITADAASSAIASATVLAPPSSCQSLQLSARSNERSRFNQLPSPLMHLIQVSIGFGLLEKNLQCRYLRVTSIAIAITERKSCPDVKKETVSSAAKHNGASIMAVGPTFNY